MSKVDLSNYKNLHSFRNKIVRTLWQMIWLVLFRPSPKIFHGWRRFLLRLFGANLSKGVHVYPSCRIWIPSNLTMCDHSCLSPYVDCYCVAPIKVGAHSTVSQYSFLCTASHDYRKPNMPLVTAPIIEDQAWICADVFIGPNVKIGQGSVVGSRASVFSDVKPWTVVGGNPAKFIKKREMKLQ